MDSASSVTGPALEEGGQHARKRRKTSAPAMTAASCAAKQPPLRFQCIASCKTAVGRANLQHLAIARLPLLHMLPFSDTCPPDSFSKVKARSGLLHLPHGTVKTPGEPPPARLPNTFHFHLNYPLTRLPSSLHACGYARDNQGLDSRSSGGTELQSDSRSNSLQLLRVMNPQAWCYFASLDRQYLPPWAAARDRAY